MPLRKIQQNQVEWLHVLNQLTGESGSNGSQVMGRDD